MPVYQSHRLTADELRVGARLRSVRRARHLTLRDVARRAGLSPAFLSRIENERLRLDFDDALRLAQALGVPLEDLLPRDVSAPYQIVRHQELRDDQLRQVPLVGFDGQSGWHPNSFRPLADLFVGRHLEPAMARVVPEPDEGEPSPTLCAHHEQEFLFVVRGRMEFLIKTPDGLQRLELERGDSIYFWSSLPHRSRALGGTVAQTLQVFAAEPGFSDQGSLWLLSPYVDVVGATADEETDQLKIVGRRLRRFRVRAGLSVPEMAARLGVRRQQLDGAEAGTRGLPLTALAQAARLFGQPLREFVRGAPAEPPYFSVQRHADLASVPVRSRCAHAGAPDSAGTVTFRDLAHGFPKRRMFPCLVNTVPTDDRTLNLGEHHHGEEFIYALSHLDLTTLLDGREVTESLRPGDACYLDSSVPHTIRCQRQNPYNPVQALDVFWCPLGGDYLFAAEDPPDATSA